MFSRTERFAAMPSSARRLDTKPMPWAIDSAGFLGAIGSPSSDPPGRDARLAEDRPPDRVMAGAAQPDEPERLARPDGKRDGTDALGGEPWTVSATRCDAGRGPDERVAHRPPDDHLHEVVRVRVPGRDGRQPAAVAKNRDPVGDAEHLVKAMGDVDDADAVRAQAPQRREQSFDIGLRQRRRRFVENQNVALMASARPMATSERSAAGNDEIGASGSRSTPMIASASAAASRTRVHETRPTASADSPSGWRRSRRRSSIRRGRDPGE